MIDRPYVTLNVAMTADGKTDTFARQGAMISSVEDMERVDLLRTSSDAVMVGGNTLLGNDPRLTVKSGSLREGRLIRGLEENPIKVGVVTRSTLRKGSRFLTSGPARLIIFTTTQTDAAQIAWLRQSGVQVFVTDGPRVDLVLALQELQELGVERLLVEGGGILNEELLKNNLVDEIIVYIAPLIFGGASAPTFVNGAGLERKNAIQSQLTALSQYKDGGILLRYVLRVDKTKSK